MADPAAGLLDGALPLLQVCHRVMCRVDARSASKGKQELRGTASVHCIPCRTHARDPAAEPRRQHRGRSGLWPRTAREEATAAGWGRNAVVAPRRRCWGSRAGRWRQDPMPPQPRVLGSTRESGKPAGTEMEKVCRCWVGGRGCHCGPSGSARGGRAVVAGRGTSRPCGQGGSHRRRDKRVGPEWSATSQNVRFKNI